MIITPVHVFSTTRNPPKQSTNIAKSPSKCRSDQSEGTVIFPLTAETLIVKTFRSEYMNPSKNVVTSMGNWNLDLELPHIFCIICAYSLLLLLNCLLAVISSIHFKFKLSSWEIKASLEVEREPGDAITSPTSGPADNNTNNNVLRVAAGLLSHHSFTPRVWAPLPPPTWAASPTTSTLTRGL